MKYLIGLLLWGVVWGGNGELGLRETQIPVWPDSLEGKFAGDFATEGIEIKRDSLQTSGYKSVRVIVGEGGAEVQQELRLQIQGQVGDGWLVDGLVADQGVDQGEIRVSTLRDVEEMYLTLRNRSMALTLGDFVFERAGSAWGDFRRRSQGAWFSARGDALSAIAALGRDPVARRIVVLRAVDGQRRGYLMSGTGAFIPVVPGSETVLWRGRELRRGTDYRVEYMGGVLDFIGTLTPVSGDEITVSFEEWTEGRSAQFRAGDIAGSIPRGELRASFLQVRADSSDSGWGLWMAQGGMRAAKHLWLRSELLGWRHYRSGVDSIQGFARAFHGCVASDSSWEGTGSSAQAEWEIFWSGKGFSSSWSAAGTTQWEPYVLRRDWELDSLDSIGERRLDRMRLGLGRGNGWRTWGELGYRQGNDWNARRGAWVLRHRDGDAESRLDLAHVESWRAGLLRRSWQGMFNSRDRWGNWVPEGTGRLAWRAGRDTVRDWEISSAMHWVGRGIDQFRVEVRHEGLQSKDLLGWKDSLWRALWTQSMALRRSGGSWESLLQAGVRRDRGEPMARTANVEQEVSWNQAAWEGRWKHRMGVTEEQAFRPYYRRVGNGLGDVAWDSLTGEFVEGVDQGDYVREGLRRDDSVPTARVGELILELEPWWSPAVSMGINRGLLADMRVGFYGSWLVRDSGRVVWLPPWKENDWDMLTEGESDIAWRLRWLDSQDEAEAQYARTWTGLRRAGLYQAAENGLQDEVEWRFTAGGLDWDGKHGREDIRRHLPEVVRWRTWSHGGGFLKRLPAGWMAGPRVSRRLSKGVSQWGEWDFRRWQWGLRVNWNPDGRGSAWGEYLLTHVSGGNLVVPYRVSEGYSTGWAHRLECRGNYRVKENFSLSLYYVMRVGQMSKDWFQKFSMEARADF